MYNYTYLFIISSSCQIIVYIVFFLVRKTLNGTLNYMNTLLSFFHCLTWACTIEDELFIRPVVVLRCIVLHLAVQAPNIWKLCMPVRRFGRSPLQNTNVYSASGISEVSGEEGCYSSALGYTEGQSCRNDHVHNARGSQAFHES